MPDDLVRSAFDLAAEEYADGFFHELDQKPFDRERLSAFADRCAGARVLEVGCGPGHVGRFVAERGPRVFGLDFALASLRIARRRCPGIAFVGADMRALPVRDGAVGALLSFYSLIYFDAADTEAILREYRRVLAPGAPMLLAVHAGEGSHRFTDFRGKAIDVTLRYHVPATLERQVRDAGFEIDSVETRWPYPFEHSTTRLYVGAHAR